MCELTAPIKRNVPHSKQLVHSLYVENHSFRAIELNHCCKIADSHFVLAYNIIFVPFFFLLLAVVGVISSV